MLFLIKLYICKNTTFSNDSILQDFYITKFIFVSLRLAIWNFDCIYKNTKNAFSKLLSSNYVLYKRRNICYATSSNSEQLFYSRFFHNKMQEIHVYACRFFEILKMPTVCALSAKLSQGKPWDQ